jgi:hypothetical protein
MKLKSPDQHSKSYRRIYTQIRDKYLIQYRHPIQFFLILKIYITVSNYSTGIWISVTDPVRNPVVFYLLDPDPK